MKPDVLIIGGGVIGLAIAERAQRDGLQTTVLDKGPMGAESSWAGAGMLTCRPRPRHVPGQLDYHDLTHYSVSLYREWAARLFEETGVDTGYRVCGALEVALAGFNPNPAREKTDFNTWAEACNSRGIRARVIDAKEAAELEPNLQREIAGVLEFPDEAQVRSPWLTRALSASILKNGGLLKPGIEAADIDICGSSVQGVVLADGQKISASRVVVCTGAWTAGLPSLIKIAPRCARIHPVRGQLLCYESERGLCRRLLTSSGHYIVPREDGVVLVGATQEDAGFEKATTPEGLHELEAFAQRIVPAFRLKKPAKSWSGLRPGLKGKHPVLGPVPGISGLFVAAGHYRNGFTLAPATAELVVDSILARKRKISVEFWAP